MSISDLTLENNSLSTLLSPLISEREDKKSLARKKANQYLYKTVIEVDLDDNLNKGWEISKKNKRSYRLKRMKSHDVFLEDKVWCLIDKMGYTEMNGEKFTIKFHRDDGTQSKKQIDVFGCDNETAIVVECKSKIDRGRRTLQKDIHETIYLKDFIRKSIFKHYEGKPLPKIVWIYATNNIIWSEADVERARAGDIIIITENELQYF